MLDNQDFVSIIRKVIELNNGHGEADDIDHSASAASARGRAAAVPVRMGLIRMERIIKERMTISDFGTYTSASLINARPVVAAIRSSSVHQLSQSWTRPTRSRSSPTSAACRRWGRLDSHASAQGRRPGRAPEPLDHLPIETPEGPNMGSSARWPRSDVQRESVHRDPVPRVYKDERARRGQRGVRLPLRRRGGQVHGRAGETPGR